MRRPSDLMFDITVAVDEMGQGTSANQTLPDRKPTEMTVDDRARNGP